MEGFVTVSQAAKIKQVTRQAIYLAIRLKRLKAYRHDDHWKVFLVDLNEYDNNRYSRVYHSTLDGKPVFDEAKGYFSVLKASRMINVTKQQLYYAIRKKWLKVTRKNAAIVVHVSDLFKYKETYLTNDLTLKSLYREKIQ